MVVKNVPFTSPTPDKVCSFIEIECVVEIEGEALSSWFTTSQSVQSIGVKVEYLGDVDWFVQKLNTNNIGDGHECFCEELKNRDSLLHITG